MDESIAANRIFPNSVEYKWNTDYYGPLMIPSKGLEIEINTDNLSKYGSVITNYEKNKNTTIEDGILYIDNQIELPSGIGLETIVVIQQSFKVPS